MNTSSANSLYHRSALHTPHVCLSLALGLITALIAPLGPPSTSSPQGASPTLIATASAEVYSTRSQTRTRRVTRTRRRSTARRSVRRTRTYARPEARPQARPQRRHRRSTTSTTTTTTYRRTRPRAQPSLFRDHLTLLEVGGTAYVPMVGTSLTGVSLGLGYRLGALGVLGEAQLVQSTMGAELFDLNAQLRAYLPVSPQVELFPLVLVGSSHLMQNQASGHLDLGVGAQLKLAPVIALGARYQARIMGGQNEMSSPTGHQLTAQLTLSF